MKLTGLHHVTAIAGDPQRNLDFYAGVLGLRLVKRTVNFDDPGSYHFYFGDETGSPGTIVTFFPWPHARRGVRGTGEVEATAFAIPKNATGRWLERLKTHGVTPGAITSRFGEEVIRFADPDGMLIELIASETDGDGPAIGGFHSVTAALDELAPTARVLTETFGYQLTRQEGNRSRYTAEGTAPGRHVDLLHLPHQGPGHSGAGSVHHIAFRVPDDDAQAAARRTIASRGHGVSPVMDRTYFHSIYFREPGGVLFELATDGPGFATDETPQALGSELKLPSWMESSRPRIETLLPKIQLPERRAA
jgi:glyoxalase family protein